jgi:predicted  nucleic acid-binding Zn-ribbon protein
MEEILDLLIEIQLADDELKDTESAIQSIPSKIEMLEKEINDVKQTLNEQEQRIQEIRKDYKLKEGDIAENESKIEKLGTQTFAVKTNEEYRAIINEIEFLKSENKKIEDAMIGLLEEDESLKKSLSKAESETEEYIAIRKEKLSALRTEQDSLSQKLNSVRAKFDAMFAKLPDDIKDLYSKTKTVRGNAVSLISDQICRGCSSILTPQVVNELKKRNKIITCDNCGRILIFVEPDANP